MERSTTTTGANAGFAAEDARREPALRDDLPLVRAVLSGEPRAVHEFTERMRCIPRFLSRRNAHFGSPLLPEELADLAQDVFASMWGKLGEFRGHAVLETWAYRFCVRKFLERRHRPVRSTEPLSDEIASERPALEGLLDDEHVHAALDELPRDEAVVIVLKHYDELSFGEIAQRLDLAASTVKARYYRGLLQLRTRLGRSFEGGAR